MARSSAFQGSGALKPYFYGLRPVDLIRAACQPVRCAEPCLLACAEVLDGEDTGCNFVFAYDDHPPGELVRRLKGLLQPEAAVAQLDRSPAGRNSRASPSAIAFFAPPMGAM